MSGRLRNSLTAIVAGFIAAVCVNAQDGTYGGYTPYSVYGIGEIHNYGSAFIWEKTRELLHSSSRW